MQYTLMNSHKTSNIKDKRYLITKIISIVGKIYNNMKVKELHQYQLKRLAKNNVSNKMCGHLV
jgi:hypothetical protein